MTVSKTTTIGALTIRYEAETIEELVALIAALDGNAPSDDGWIKWTGGACPVSPGTIVDVKFRNGKTRHNTPAYVWSWDVKGSPWKIVAYRVSRHD